MLGDRPLLLHLSFRARGDVQRQRSQKATDRQRSAAGIVVKRGRIVLVGEFRGPKARNESSSGSASVLVYLMVKRAAEFFSDRMVCISSRDLKVVFELNAAGRSAQRELLDLGSAI